jgi:Hemerythrin HHE cation binding domain
MASSRTIERSGRADWTLMTAIHDALRHDLDELITTTAGPAAARARWIVFRDQLRRHLAAEHAAMWRPARAKLTSDPRGQALLEAMDDEQQLIGPLRAVADAFTMAARPAQLRPLLARLQTKLTSHLAHEEADALPLLGQIMSPAELGAIARAPAPRS